MKKTTLWVLLLCGASCFTACKNDDTPGPVLLEKSTFSVNGHALTAYLHDQGTDYVVVFESGLGDGVQPWREQKVLEQAAEKTSVIGYNRAGYADSGNGPGPRDIPTLRQDLEKLLEAAFPGKKYVLVAHSLGGLVIRDFALKNPEKTAALLFIDPSHESYNHPTDAQEDMLVAAFGANTGAGMEARQLVEDLQYAAAMPGLPDKPAVVITSKKTSSENDAADRQQWYDAHDELGAGLSDFTHIATTQSGHYIQRTEPDLVLQYLNTLLGKLQ
ncbi:MAG: alpha/beta fold hydrolase [Saprospiraceae bacterium]|nr:alpha/beta fold hydrolase [Saprospiraceae bacterium]